MKTGVCSKGLLITMFFVGAFALTATQSSAYTICECPQWWVWQNAHGKVGSASSCPTDNACEVDAWNAAVTACGYQGVCTTGSFTAGGCYYSAGCWFKECDLQYVCNFCTEYPDW